MRAEDFVEVSAYLRVLEKRVLSGPDIDRISDTPDVAEALRQISQNSEYDFSSLKRNEDYERVLKDGIKNTYEMLCRLVPHRAVIDLPIVKYDFHNLRVALKSNRLGLDFGYLYSDLSSLDMPLIESFVETGESTELEPYIVNAIVEAKAAFAEGFDPQEIDIVMDRHMFVRMLDLCNVIQNDFITDYFRYSIDFQNIKTFLRVKNMRKGTRFLSSCLIPGGITDTGFFVANYDKTPDMLASVFYYKYFGDMIGKGMEGHSKFSNYSNLEKLLDDFLIDYIKKAKYIAFGPEVPFAYIISKENEARQIRILVTCKSNDMRTETLKERLRENYA